MSDIAVIGAGAWGTALAIQAARSGDRVALWARDPAKIDAILPNKQQQAMPLDPLTENQNAIMGMPLKAGEYQDHDAHIAVHMSMLQDPTIAQLIGQNPRAPQIQAALTAHISEHVGYAYRQKIEQQLGMPLPPEDEKLPPEIETALHDLDLEFVGFEADSAVLRLQRAETGPDSTLQAWARFEDLHPRAFLGMYQFWCQAPAGS